YLQSGQKLVNQILEFAPVKKKVPNILVLHASSHETSNSIGLWNLIKDKLDGKCTTKEISLRNGTVMDCIGCPYKMCLHFGEGNSCYYGGVIVEQVYPAILECDGLLLLCPNYNDALSANLSAFINRLTALFRKTGFYDKYLFGIIVSGYSGSDIVAEQLIAGLNMNKSFILPSHFAMMETANNPGSIFNCERIEERAKGFAENMLSHLLLR
ncbi:MAG: NAD(P)H-dependent oxidoreductase, partial [Anaerovorax sp.]